MRAADESGRFVDFPSFEMHRCADGYRTVVYRDLGGEILYPDSLADLHRQIEALRRTGVKVMETRMSQKSESAPNVVLILTDQMRGDCMSVSGHPVVETPNLDILAARGVNFTAAYSSCPSCIAARATLFTGQRPTTTGRLGYRDQVPWRYRDTLAEVLRSAGYQTHCIGKRHFYPQMLHLGFDAIETYEAGQFFDRSYVNDYYEWLAEKSNGRYEERDHGVQSNSWYARPSHLPEELHNNTWVASRACQFLRHRDPTRPFFLNLSFHRPHPPADPPQVYYGMYRDREIPPVPIGDWAHEHDLPVTDINAWRGRLPPRLLEHYIRAYCAQIAHIDNQVGRVLCDLQKHGPTWIIFTADHGEMLGDHHMFRKTYAYEGSARIPFIVCPPTACREHSESAPVGLEDVMPTILTACGIAVPETVEGAALQPLIADEAAPATWRPYLHGEHSDCYGAATGMQYLTDGRRKYIWYTRSGREQFFDLEDDRAECRDLAADPARAEEVRVWRRRLVDELTPRTDDGLVADGRLVAGKSLPAVRPELLAV